MFKVFKASKKQDKRVGFRRANDAIADLVNEFQAVIIFEPNGNIIQANDNFLDAMGYKREEVMGSHHRIFVDAAYAASDDYAAFWKRLAAGESFTDRFVRYKKTGEKIWIDATYSPSRNPQGEIVRVVKVAVDVTQHEMDKRVVEALEHGLRELGDGNLKTRIPSTGANSGLSELFNSAVDQISSTLARSQGVGASVADAASSLENASLELTRQSETQAAAVEETSAAVRGADGCCP